LFRYATRGCTSPYAESSPKHLPRSGLVQIISRPLISLPDSLSGSYEELKTFLSNELEWPKPDSWWEGL
jgi:hypothetical protein